MAKRDPIVERIVRRERKRATAKAGEWLPQMPYTAGELRALIAEVRRETARECAKIGERGMYGAKLRVARAIRKSFGLEK